MPLRQAIFWIHLVCGILAGISIAVMSFTGVALAYEKQIIAWAERDARQVTPPAPDAPRLSLEQLAARVREKHPEARPTSVVVANDPHQAVSFSLGRSGAYYVNPYTGEVREADAGSVRGFMSTMITWHRYFGFGGEQRGIGKAINGACNLAFLGLALTGLYIWFPRKWSWRAFRPAIWFNGQWRGKPRDWNWHNVIGFWSAPVLIVLTATALPISYQWAGNLINTLTGTPASAGGGRGPAPGAGPEIAMPTPPAGAVPLGQDALLAKLTEHAPNWTQITMRLGGGPGGPAGGRGGREEGARGGARGGAGQAEREAPPRASAEDASARARGPQPVSFTVRESGSWPRTATTTLTFDPFSGELLQREGFSDLPAGRQVRSWTRFLHTGEALGYGGQFVAGLASLGGVVLCYTGFALAWRRFFGKRPKAPRPMTAERETDTAAVTAESTN